MIQSLLHLIYLLILRKSADIRSEEYLFEKFRKELVCLLHAEPKIGRELAISAGDRMVLFLVV